MSVILRAATIDDSYLLKNWDLDEAVGYSGGDDDSYDWDYELPRNVDWREFLIAEVDAVPIGMIVLIDALQSNHRAIKFYRRIGFTDVGPRRFENDDCLVMSMTRDIFES